MKKDIVLFDLDGTLVNTIPAIANSFNYGLEKFGYKTYTVEEYKKFVGKGFLVLFDRINKIQKIKENKEDFIKIVRDHYEKNYLNGIKLYDNIDRLLDELTRLNIDIAIVTNKDHNLAIEHTKTILSKWNFKYVYGAPLDNSHKIKPDPYIVNLIAKNYDKKRMLFVGDMIIDYDTAKNANIDLVYCDYGYGGKALVECNNISDPIQVLEYVK